MNDSENCHYTDSDFCICSLSLQCWPIATGANADLGGYTAVVPGQPEHSALIARIMADDDSIMSPNNFHKSLNVQQKQLLKQWISQGAAYDEHGAFSRRFDCS